MKPRFLGDCLFAAFVTVFVTMFIEINVLHFMACIISIFWLLGLMEADRKQLLPVALVAPTRTIITLPKSSGEVKGQPRLPLELLQEIFILCTYLHYDLDDAYANIPPFSRKLPNWDPNRAPRKLLYVCKSWRNIATSIPDLWNRFSLSEESFPLFIDAKCEGALNFLTFSKSRTLTISVRLSEQFLHRESYGHEYGHKLITLLEQHITRWRHVQFTALSDSWFSSRLVSDLHLASGQLQTIILGGSSLEDWPLLKPTDHLTLPEVKQLDLRVWLPLSMSVNKLETLALSSRDAEIHETLRSISMSPLLTSFRASFSYSTRTRNGEQRTPFVHDLLSELCLEERSSLPSFYLAKPRPLFEEFFDHFRLPSLKTLRLRFIFPTELPFESLIRFLESSSSTPSHTQIPRRSAIKPDLETLIIEDNRYRLSSPRWSFPQAHAFVRVLANTPHLRTLILKDIPAHAKLVSALSGRLDPSLDVIQPNKTKDNHLGLKWEYDCALLCPELEHLELVYDPLDYPISELLGMLRTRLDVVSDLGQNSGEVASCSTTARRTLREVTIRIQHSAPRVKRLRRNLEQPKDPRKEIGDLLMLSPYVAAAIEEGVCIKII